MSGVLKLFFDIIGQPDAKKMAILTFFYNSIESKHRRLAWNPDLFTQKEDEKMKKSMLLFIMVLLLASCGAVSKSEFLQHDTMYKNWDHMKFSWYGYRNPTAQDSQETKDQQWWGIEVPYVPGQ